MNTINEKEDKKRSVGDEVTYFAMALSWAWRWSGRAWLLDCLHRQKQMHAFYALCSLRFRFVFVGGALCSNLWVRTDFGLACFVAPSILSFARAKHPISMILFLVDSMFNNNKTMKDEMLNATRSTVGLFIFKMDNISFFSFLFFYFFLFFIYPYKILRSKISAKLWVVEIGLSLNPIEIQNSKVSWTSKTKFGSLHGIDSFGGSASILGLILIIMLLV